MNPQTNYTQTIVASVAMVTVIGVLIVGGIIVHAALCWGER